MTMEATADESWGARPSSLMIVRTVIGLAQGIALYLLYRAKEVGVWPATDGTIFAPLLLVVVFVPVLVLAALNNLRTSTLILWAIPATFALTGLALHDIVREPYEDAGASRIIPSLALWAVAASGLFIAHALIAAGDTERKIVAGYPGYFDVSWKHGTQLGLGLGFVGLFWALLLLGAALFRLIQIQFLLETIQRPWFAVPATTLVFACAMHVTDVRVDLVRGMRTLALTLLSWLMPLMAALVAAFLLALLFTGLDPLWSTRHATHILLASAAALIFLLNAAYQDGRFESPLPPVLRYAGYATTAALAPLVILAAYSLTIRVRQYGWTPDRIIVVACIAVASCYAVGYALAAIRSRPWLKWLEITNVLTAFVTLALLLSLFTPIADPTRISVADQLSRLASGRTPPEQFDFNFLRFSAGRYGREALEKLAQNRDGPRATDIAQRAEQAIRQQNRWARPPQPPAQISPQVRAANISVFPAGRTLPDSFLQQEWQGTPGQWPRCLTTDAKCDAVMVDIDGDGISEIVLFSSPAGVAAAFNFKDSKWAILGTLSNTGCPGAREAIRTGQVDVAPTVIKDLEAGGQRLRVTIGCK